MWLHAFGEVGGEADFQKKDSKRESETGALLGLLLRTSLSIYFVSLSLETKQMHTSDFFFSKISAAHHPPKARKDPLLKPSQKKKNPKP